MSKERIRYYIADAFVSGPFRGNPAGVCLTGSGLDDDTMLRIASENNLAETAFLQKQKGGYYLRWFSPEGEIDLCGHATLAAAFVLMNFIDTSMSKVSFSTASGILQVERSGDLYFMDFPGREPAYCPTPDILEKALGAAVSGTFLSRDMIAVLKNETAVRNLQPDIRLLGDIGRDVCVTAKGDGCDFVSRFFIPGAAVPEDPVTGSSHCSLIPFWSARLGKKKMTARQLSRRGGELLCEDRGERVTIGGRASVYLIGEIYI